MVMERVEVAKKVMAAASELENREWSHVQRMLAIIASAVLLEDDNYLFQDVFAFKEKKLKELEDEISRRARQGD